MEHSEVVLAHGFRRQLAHRHGWAGCPPIEKLANFGIKLGHGTALPLASLDVAAQVPVITGHLASHEELRDWLQHPQHAAQLAAGHEVNPRPLAVGLERPRSVDWVGPFDDVHVDADRPLELGELDDLLELLAARELRALPDTRA